MTAIAATPAGHSWAQAQYPTRPITVISPFAPGGINDTCARLIARGLETAFGRPAVSENRPGASSMIGMGILARSDPDGHTLLTCSDRIVCFPTIGKTPFDIEKDFAPVTQLVSAPMFLVTRSGLGVKTVADLVALAKSGKSLSFASTGTGATTHLTGESFKARAGIDMIHVPYKGATPALTDVLAGHVDLMFADLGTATPFVRAGQINPVAVARGSRLTMFPDIPTFIESGFPDFEAKVWIGLLARAGTPDAVIDRLNREVINILASSQNRKIIEDMGAEVSTNTPKEFADMIASERKRLQPILTRANIKADE